MAEDAPFPRSSTRSTSSRPRRRCRAARSASTSRRARSSRRSSRARVAFYKPSHIERLKLIAQLQDRGLRIDAIRELVLRIDKGEVDVNEWLGIEAQLAAPWADDAPRTATEAEIYELAGSRRPGLLGDLARARS